MVELQMRSVLVVVVALAAHVAASSDDPSEGAGIARRFEELERRLRDQEAAIQGLERKSAKQQSMIEGLQKKASEQDSMIQTQQDQIRRLQDELSTERQARAASNENTNGGAKLNIVNRETAARSSTKRQERTKVAFTAYLNHDMENASQKAVVFNEVITNEGNGYNNNTGTFTCTEPGMYLFIYNIGLSSETASSRVNWANLHVNSGYVVGSVVETSHDFQDLQGGNAAILRLKPGDVVWVESFHQHIQLGFKSFLTSNLFKSLFTFSHFMFSPQKWHISPHCSSMKPWSYSCI